MSFLDLDEWLPVLAARADVVYSPFVDAKRFPEDVDVVLVEGAVANEDNRTMALTVRANSKTVVSFGDCAVTGNVTALRNALGGADVVLHRSYRELPTVNSAVPSGVVPALLDRVLPLHEVIAVDYYLPGCPPPATAIREVLDALTRGARPVLTGDQLRFGSPEARR